MEALGRGGETFWRMGEHLPHFSSPLTPFPSKTFVFVESLSAAFLGADCLESGTIPKLNGPRMNTADGTLPRRQPTSPSRKSLSRRDIIRSEQCPAKPRRQASSVAARRSAPASASTSPGATSADAGSRSGMTPTEVDTSGRPQAMISSAALAMVSDQQPGDHAHVQRGQAGRHIRDFSSDGHIPLHARLADPRLNLFLKRSGGKAEKQQPDVSHTFAHKLCQRRDGFPFAPSRGQTVRAGRRRIRHP